MVEYLCSKCGFKTNKKSTYTSHINRKTPCIKKLVKNNDKRSNNDKLSNNDKRSNVATLINEIDTKSITENKCVYCGREYSRKDSLQRHIEKTCKNKQKIDDNQDIIFNKLIKKVDDLQNKMTSDNTIINESNNNKNEYNYKAETINNTKNISNNTLNNIQNNIQNNQHINLVSFGKEDMSFITDAVCKYMIDRGFKSIPRLVEFVHFNRNHPEYHNIFISHFREKYVWINYNRKWKLQDRDETIEQLIDDKKDFLTEKFHNLKEELNPSSIKKFNRFLDQQDEDSVIQSLKKDVKLILYNGRDMARETRSINNKKIEL
jgi:hypothetical protein